MITAAIIIASALALVTFVFAWALAYQADKPTPKPPEK